jgi:cohesin complex subunit SCC1
MIQSLRTGFDSTDTLSYNDLTRNKNRRVAAVCLFELLVLKTKDYVEIEQDSPFADISITATETLVDAEA